MTTSGTVTGYSLPGSCYITAIVAGPDGKLWFSCGDESTASIDTMATTGGTVTQYPLLAGEKIDDVNDITVGPDNNLWFTDFSEAYTNGKIGKITTSGKITEYSLRWGFTDPHDIVTGPDKNLWFGGYSNNAIEKSTTSGSTTEYSVPKGSEPWGIVAGPNGNLWFTNVETGKIGEITTSGTITEEYSLAKGSRPEQITVGADGNLWFCRAPGVRENHDRRCGHRISARSKVVHLPASRPGPTIISGTRTTAPKRSTR